MEMTFRWFGPDDPVRLENIRQIPGGAIKALRKAWRRTTRRKGMPLIMAVRI